MYPEHRKLPADERQRKGRKELTSEQLPEISFQEDGKRRVGADGSRPLSGQDIRYSCHEAEKSVSVEGVTFHEQEWYRVRYNLSSLESKETEDFLFHFVSW